MKVPYLSNHGTFIHNGSEISTISQSRLQPGVYHRKKSSGELEAHFNMKRGTGSSFRIELEPNSGIFRMKVGQASLKLYPLLSALGISDADLEKKWGKELMEKNRSASDSRVLSKAHTRLVRRADPNKSDAEKIEEIRSALNSGMVSREVISRTLPNFK
jgi:DNA-directed RNA polymerase beta subunit